MFSKPTRPSTTICVCNWCYLWCSSSVANSKEGKGIYIQKFFLSFSFLSSPLLQHTLEHPAILSPHIRSMYCWWHDLRRHREAVIARRPLSYEVVITAPFFLSSFFSPLSFFLSTLARALRVSVHFLCPPIYNAATNSILSINNARRARSPQRRR